jgi:hypothetical protein
MYLPTRLQIGAALLVASLGTFARASDDTGGAASPSACIAEYRIVFTSGRVPGKSTPFLRKAVNAPAHCEAAAPGPLFLTVFTDVAGGAVLLKGEHAAAIAEIHSTKPTHSADSLPLTNLCVAQIAGRDWANARPTCDSAVEAALRDRVRAPSQPFSNRDQYRDFVAIAYSNRAVLMLLSNDMTAGENDLARAQKVAPRARFVQRNLDATRLVRDARVLAQSTPAN